MRIGLQNFQGIGEFQEITFTPLTLLYGENSAGKSIIHDALLVCEKLFDRFELALPSKWVHRNSKQGAKVSRGTETILRISGLHIPDSDYVIPDDWIPFSIPYHESEILQKLAKQIDEKDFHFSCEYRWQGTDQRAKLSGFKIEIQDEPALDWSIGPSGGCSLNLNNPFIQNFRDEILNSSLLNHMFITRGDEVFSSVKLEGFDASNLCISFDLYYAVWDGQAERTDPLVTLLAFLVSWSTRRVSNVCKMGAIEPLRPVEPGLYTRSLPLKPHLNKDLDFGYRALANTLVVDKFALDETGAESLRQINRWLSSPAYVDSGYTYCADFEVTLGLQDLLASTPHTTTLDGILKWPSGQLSCKILLTDLRTGHRVGMTDVGVGVSQVTPILIASATNESVFIQQPELHLHPRIQANLGDIFVESKKQGRYLIVETHSELLLLRILRRIRETHEDRSERQNLTIAAKDVSVVYVERDSNGTTSLRQLRLTDQGDFIDRWPKGFFAERDAEIF